MLHSLINAGPVVRTCPAHTSPPIATVPQPHSVPDSPDLLGGPLIILFLVELRTMAPETRRDVPARQGPVIPVSLPLPQAEGAMKQNLHSAVEGPPGTNSRDQ